MGRVPGGPGARGIAVLGLLLALLAAPPSRGADDVGSVRVGPLRVEAPASLKGGHVSVSVAIGERPLWQSPVAVVPAAPWRVSLRAFTARRLPLVFRVLAGETAAARPPPAPPAPSSRRSRSVREQDAAIASGMDALVTDYGAGTLDDPGEPFDRALATATSRSSRPGPAAPGDVRCTTRLAWPPADGEHRLECGPYTVVVMTSWVGR